MSELVGKTVDWVGPGVPVHFHGHNDFGLATAAAVAAVRAGASWIQGTINGMGERAGNANLGEAALTLRALYGVESNLRLDRIRDVSRTVQELSGYALDPWKPVTGETLFRCESGAVASQFHDPPSIEPYSSRLVAAELRSEVRAGRLDGDAVNSVLKAAGHRVSARREWPAGLTAREVEVLGLLARGYSSRQIAERRLHCARDRRAEPAAELFGGAADQSREHRDRQRRDEERQDGGGTREMDACRDAYQHCGETELDEVAASHVHIIEP